MLSNHKLPSWTEVNIVFLHSHVNGIVFFLGFLQIDLKLCGRESE
jgi:hypothetical protein